MAIQIKKAVRERIFLKLVVTGASGSGKTYGALGVAMGLAPTGKILVIDTENRSASYYAGRWDFDVVELEAPFTTQKYNEALQAAIDNGYEVVVIDSLTHEWAGSGGLQDQKSQKDSRGGNSFTNWNEMKQLHNQFTEKLLQSRIHVIGTLRSKMSYVLENDEKGKATPRKVGMAPISADDMEYEFGVMFDVDRNSHLAVASKDRTNIFEGRSLNLDETVGRELAAWLASGADLAPVPPTPEPPNPTTKPQQAAARPTKAPAAPAQASPVTAPSELPAAFVEAMAELAAVTVGMPEKTRSALVLQFEKDGPTSLPALLAEIESIRSIMQPESAGAVVLSLPKPASQPINQAAADFVDDMDPDTDTQNGGIDDIQYEALTKLCGAFGINRDSLRNYMAKAGHLLPGANGPTLARMKAEEFAKLRDKLCNNSIAAKGETWSARTVRIINATPTTTYQPMTAAS